MLNFLYGDGIHDDTAAIQEMIDTNKEVNLPPPKVCYLISKPLVLHSNCSISLPRLAEIRLADGANCYMLKNETRDDYRERTQQKAFSFINLYSPDYPCENIRIEGGIWNFNNKNQNPNPLATKKYEPLGYTGIGFLFYNVKNLEIVALTLKDPVNFSVTLDKVSQFVIKNISFDFNDGNPYQANMDGIHIDGNCHNGKIENLNGTCYDDIVALNAEEGSCGPISNISIKGIFTENSYSAVRLLSARPETAVSDIHISDICGTFYHFGIAFMRNYETGQRGRFENITIENIRASKSSRALVNHPWVLSYPQYAVIDIGDRLDIKNLKILNVERKEFVDTNAATVKLYDGTVVENLVMQDITAKNCVDDGDMPFIENYATVIK